MSGTNEKNFTLYLHITPSGKKYFGITSQIPKYRWNNGRGYKDNQHFWTAIEKYNWNNIAHIILADDLTKDEACLFEQIFIALYDTTNRSKGYNFTSGGEHFTHSDESKRKISESQKIKMGSEEMRQKLSEAHKGKTGKKHPQSRTVICITTRQVYYGTHEAGRITGVNRSHISSVCRGKRKSAGKSPDGLSLRWAYVQDLPKPQVSEEIKQLLRNGPRLLKSA